MEETIRVLKILPETQFIYFTAMMFSAEVILHALR
jgi:hypothetical protein